MTKKTRCPRCKGRGVIRLPEVLAAVLAAIAQCPGTTAADLWRMDKANEIGASAFNNRVSRLFKMGLIRRKREGKEWRLFPK